MTARAAPFANDQSVAEPDAIAEVDRVRRQPTPQGIACLIALLSERHSIYAGKSTNQVARFRGYVLASFESTGLPDAALPFVLEELQSGHDTYAVAAAARALRGTRTPASWMIPFVAAARRRLENVDDSFTFEAYGSICPLVHPTTFRHEIQQTLAWLDPHTIAAPETDACCPLPPGIARLFIHDRAGRRRLRLDAVPGTIVFEDQDGRLFTDTTLFVDKPSIVAFFYTRCDNPRKCSLTMTSMAHVQTALREQGLSDRVRLVAISYDPDYDTPARLAAYAGARGFVCGDEALVLRVRQGFEHLLTRFDLQVSSAGAVINQHAIELRLVDDAGRTAISFSRLRWDPAAVVRAVRPLLRTTAMRRRPPRIPRVRAWLSIPASLVAIFFPRCPLCWASYLAMVGLPGLMTVLANPWWRRGALVLLVLNLALTMRTLWNRALTWLS
jgi:protein SCO1/2